MNKKWCVAVVLTALAAAVSAPAGASTGRRAESVSASARPAAAKFSWTGSCKVKCQDGRCEEVCRTGLVFAFSSADAQVEVEAALRAEASSRGQVVEGSFDITIKLAP